MPRYFFNIRDGSDLRDEHGVELSDLKAAREVAVGAASDAIRDLAHSATFWDTGDWRLDVTDEQDTQVITLRLSGHSQN